MNSGLMESCCKLQHQKDGEGKRVRDRSLFCVGWVVRKMTSLRSVRCGNFFKVWKFIWNCQEILLYLLCR